MATATMEQGKGGKRPQFYTAEEIAPWFRTSPKSIYRWAKDPKKALASAARKNIGGGVLFEASRVDRLLALMAEGKLE